MKFAINTLFLVLLSLLILPVETFGQQQLPGSSAPTGVVTPNRQSGAPINLPAQNQPAVSSQERQLLFRDFYIGQPRADIETRSNVRADGERLIIDDYFLGRKVEIMLKFDNNNKQNLSTINLRINVNAHIPPDGPAGRAPAIEYGWLQAAKGYFTERGYDICFIESRAGMFDPLRDKASPGDLWGKIAAIEIEGVSYALLPFARQEAIREMDRSRGTEFADDLMIFLIRTETLRAFRERNAEACGETDFVGSEPKVATSIFMSKGAPEIGMSAYYIIIIGE